MPTYPEIYAHHAERYDELVRHEDHERHVAAALEAAFPGRPGEPTLAVELGCGTGRVTRLLAPLVSEVRAYDGSEHMIQKARALVSGVLFFVADNASLPEPDGVADLIVAGWTLGHLTGFFPGEWEPRARAALGEMLRVARPGATLIVLETLGTCVEAPAPPNPGLAAFYALLEGAFGFARRTLSTDYAFSSVEEAERIMGFFFGQAMAEKVRARGSKLVPEWTGLWRLAR